MSENYIKDLMTLFVVFFRIGLFSIGGGYVMLPMLRREMVEHLGWITEEELLNYYAIGQATPGIIAINTATFVGYKRRGIIGATVATCGMVGPSLIIITIIAAFFTQFQNNPYVLKAFSGIRVAVALVLVYTVASMAKKAIKDYLGIGIAVIALILVAFVDVSPIPIIVAAMIMGIVLGYLNKKKQETP